MTTQTQQTREDWLRGLTVGDEVCYRGETGRWYTLTVAAVRDNNILARPSPKISGHTFSLKTGRLLGTHIKTKIEPIGEEALLYFAHRDRVRMFQEMEWETVPTIVLEAMHTAYVAALKANEEAKP